jgi:hypothetical protein
MANSVKRLTATGDVTTGPTNLQAITVSGTGGTVELKDGGSGGVSKGVFGAVTSHIVIPGGMRFPNGLHATLTTADDVSFWLGDS